MTPSHNLSPHMVNKYMRVTSKGVAYSGKCIWYIQAADNEPEIDLIAIESEDGECLGFFENDIESIEFL